MLSMWGKNASLGEMISNLAGAGVSVPGGFATTAQAYRDFLEQSGLNDQIHAALDALDVDDVAALAKTGAQIRQWVMDAEFPAPGCRDPFRLRRHGRWQRQHGRGRALLRHRRGPA